MVSPRSGLKPAVFLDRDGVIVVPHFRNRRSYAPRRLEDFRAERREVQEGGRTVITEPGRIIIRDPSGQAYVRHSEVDRFRYGARDIRTQTVGGETRTVVMRPDGSEVITVVGRDGELMRRIRRERCVGRWLSCAGRSAWRTYCAAIRCGWVRLRRSPWMC